MAAETGTQFNLINKLPYDVNHVETEFNKMLSYRRETALQRAL